VGVDSVLTVKHYGTIYAMQDYDTKAHFAYLTVYHRASDKLKIHAMASINKSTAELEQVSMPDVSSEVETALSHQDFTFEGMHRYSNLDYTFLRASIGFAYQLTPTVTFTADGDFADVKDDSGGWVYGDESGSLYMIRSGFKIGL
jgi:hypothetical protein